MTLDPRSGEIDACPPRNLDSPRFEGDASAVTILMNPRVPTSPELRLAHAVLADAVAILTGECPSKLMEFQEAQRWLEDVGDHGAFSFVGLCHAFDLNPTAARVSLMAKSEAVRALFRGNRYQTSISEKLSAAGFRRSDPDYVAPEKPGSVPVGTLIDERACVVCGQRFFVYSGFGQTGRQIYCDIRCRRKWARSSEERRVAIRVRCRLRREGQLTIGAA